MWTNLRSTLPWAARALLAVLLAAVSLAAGGAAAASAAGSSDLSVWQGTAGAAGVHVIVNTDPQAVPVDSLIDVQTPQASSSWDSTGTAEARGSTLYPGPTGTGGLGLLCQFGLPCPSGFPPDYPLTAEATTPSQPDAATPTGYARAHAEADHVHSSAQPGNVLDTGPVAQLIAADGASTVTDQQRTDNGVVATARSRLTNVSLAGQVTIAVIEATTTSRLTDKGPEVGAALHIAGIRGPGGEVLVGDKGITVSGQSAGSDALDQLNAQLADRLKDTGVQLRVLGTDGSVTENSAHANVFGLFVHVRRSLDGPNLPQVGRAYRAYVATGVLGEASSTMRTGSELGLDLGLDPTTTSAGGMTGGTTGPTAGSGIAGPPSSASGTGAPMPAADAAAGGSGPAPQIAAPAAGGNTSGQHGGFVLLAGDAARDLSRGFGILAGLATILFVLSRRSVQRVARQVTEGGQP